MKTAKEPEESRPEAEHGEDPPAPVEKTARKAAEKHSQKAEKSSDEGAADEAGAPIPSQLDDLFATVRRLEAFAVEEAKRVSEKVLPQAESKARQNIWVSLLFALGLGLILGLWLNGRRRA